MNIIKIVLVCHCSRRSFHNNVTWHILINITEYLKKNNYNFVIYNIYSRRLIKQAKSQLRRRCQQIQESLVREIVAFCDTFYNYMFMFM